jgi:cathepsin B
MFKLVIVGTVMAVASALKSHPIRHEIVADIRAKTAGWEAHDPETNPLAGYTREQLLGLVGTYTPEPRVADFDDSTNVSALPTNFDPRTDATWKDCVHPIRDQAQCGSCWAFGATEALSDRFCKAGKSGVILSPQDLVSCDYNNYGCDGGYLNLAW